MLHYSLQESKQKLETLKVGIDNIILYNYSGVRESVVTNFLTQLQAVLTGACEVLSMVESHDRELSELRQFVNENVTKPVVVR